MLYLSSLIGNRVGTRSQSLENPGGRFQKSRRSQASKAMYRKAARKKPISVEHARKIIQTRKGRQEKGSRQSPAEMSRTEIRTIGQMTRSGVGFRMMKQQRLPAQPAQTRRKPTLRTRTARFSVKRPVQKGSHPTPSVMRTRTLVTLTQKRVPYIHRCSEAPVTRT